MCSAHREYEIAIEVSEQRLREYGLSFSMVADAVRRSSLNLAGGTIRTAGEEIRVRTVGRKYTGEELAAIVVLADPEGEIITLDRIARHPGRFHRRPHTGTHQRRAGRPDRCQQNQRRGFTGHLRR